MGPNSEMTRSSRSIIARYNNLRLYNIAGLKVGFSGSHIPETAAFSQYTSSDNVDFDGPPLIFNDSDIEAANVRLEDTLGIGDDALALMFLLAERMPEFRRILVHAAAIRYRDTAYLFAAPSGVGKSTHVSLWREYLGPEVSVICGDKPIIKIDYESETVMVCGTPWGGKEGWQSNVSAPVGGICILERGDNNAIHRLTPSHAIDGFMRQVYIPQTKRMAVQTLELVASIFALVPIYNLRCNVSQEAVMCSFEAMTGLPYAKCKVEPGDSGIHCR